MTKLTSQLQKGAWSSAVAYTIGDYTSINGSSYVCIANHTNQTPPNATYWALVAQAGTNGTNGTNGTGDVNGPASATANAIALYNGTTGKIIKDSGLAVPSGAIVGTTDTQTLTNKRVTKRTGTTASSATPTINTDNVDFYSITALAAAITSFTTNLTGTPTENQTLWIAITDDGTARAITWGAKFEASGTVSLPTTTVISIRLDIGFVWNVATSKWRCIAVA